MWVWLIHLFFVAFSANSIACCRWIYLENASIGIVASIYIINMWYTLNVFHPPFNSVWVVNATCLAGLSYMETLEVIIIVVLGRCSGYRKEKEMVHLLKSTWSKNTLHVGALTAPLGFTGPGWPQPILPTAQNPIAALQGCQPLPQGCCSRAGLHHPTTLPCPAMGSDEPGPPAVSWPGLALAGGAQFPRLGLSPSLPAPWLALPPWESPCYWPPAHREQPALREPCQFSFFSLAPLPY